MLHRAHVSRPHDSELNRVYLVVAGDLRLHRHKLLRRRRHVSDSPLFFLLLLLVTPLLVGEGKRVGYDSITTAYIQDTCE